MALGQDWLCKERLDKERLDKEQAVKNTNADVCRSVEVEPRRHYVSAFHFDANKACYCGSGSMLGQCCGAPGRHRRKPKNIGIINNFIASSDCRRLIRHAQNQRGSWLPVLDSNRTRDRAIGRKIDPSRVTEYVQLGHWQVKARRWMASACEQVLARIAPIHWYESPQLLRYGLGGKYGMHSDAEHFDRERGRFYRHIDRDFSMLIYLNDCYKGGELHFPWLNYRYQPVAGDLVFFPSNHIFTHESLPITQGTKYALVSWGAFKGSPRVNPPRGRVLL